MENNTVDVSKQKDSPEDAEMRIDITNNFWKTVFIVLALGMVVFHLYTTIFGIFPALIQRSIHLGLALSFCYILLPFNKKAITQKRKVPWYDMILVTLSLFTTLYIPFIYSEIIERPNLWVSNIDAVNAFILLILLLEAGRRTVGWTFPIMVLFALVYTYFGPHFPGKWGHPGYDFSTILQTLYHSSNGVWGTMLGISATILAIFAIFGGTLIAIGAGNSFFKISQILTGGSRGGAAKVSVVSSGLFGMISGSAVSNVVTTGNFTIPSMKRNGFSAPFAGAVESTASTGGQIVPPILGAAAFIMAQTLGVEYLTIAIATIVPCLLYYFGVFMGVDLEARRQGIESIKKDKEKLHITSLALFIIPISVFMYFLFNRYTPSVGGAWAIFSGIVLFVLLKPKLPKENTKTLKSMGIGVTISSAKTVMQIAALLACAQIVISLISLTGVGVKLSSFVIGFAEESLFLALVLTAIICIILGMGLPTTAAYVIASSVLGPALIQLGIEPLVAHLFIFYFAIMATITPPVCAAVFLAAALANTGWWKTAVNAMKLALSAYIVPFAFVYSDSLLMMGPISERVTSTVTAFIGVFLITVASIGYIWRDLNFLLRIILGLAGILLITPVVTYSIIGFLIGGATLFFFWLFKVNKQDKQDEMLTGT